MSRAVSFTLNGKPVQLETDDKRTLLWVLRTDLGLTGTKYGCGDGLCGACTVVVDGKAVRSCQTSLAEVQGRKVTTIEGLASGRQAPPAPAGLRRPRRLPVRLLHAGHDHERVRPAAREPAALARGDRRRRWRATSAAAAPTSGSSRPSTSASRNGRRPRHERRDLDLTAARSSSSSAAASSSSSRLEPPGPLRARAGAAIPTDFNAYLPHRRGRPRHGLLRQDRDGPGRHDLAGADGRRGAGRGARRRSTWSWATPTAARGTWGPSAR